MDLQYNRNLDISEIVHYMDLGMLKNVDTQDVADKIFWYQKRSYARGYDEGYDDAKIDDGLDDYFPEAGE